MQFVRPSALLILFGCSGFLLGAHSALPRIVVRGELAGQRISTTVDSELARYYLENYLPNYRANAGLDSLLDRIHQNTDNNAVPTREYLKHLANAYSVDFAALLQGSPLADAAARGTKRWLAKLVTLFKGWDFASIESMTTHRSRARFEALQIPKDILVINYIGIPMSGDTTKLAKDGYEDLRREGPNDGLALIADEIFPEGTTVVELGLDHYFQSDDIDLKTAALAQTIITRLESKQQEATATDRPSKAGLQKIGL